MACQGARAVSYASKLLLFAVIALAIKLSSSGPVFYAWPVVGLNRRPFTGYKFRTMVQNADEMKEELLDNNEMRSPAFKMRRDPGVTRVGRFLRKFSLDEPALLNRVKVKALAQQNMRNLTDLTFYKSVNI
jgi:lipopolysaccharide/colanic/teichoic acid biosynthesis glycosyltransferase